MLELYAGIGVLTPSLKPALRRRMAKCGAPSPTTPILVNDARVTNDKATISETDFTADGVIKLSLDG